MDDYSGDSDEIPPSATSATSATSIVASGLGWGLGLFAGILLFLLVAYVVVFRLRQQRHVIAS